MGYMPEPSNVSGLRTVLLAALIDADLGLAYDLATGLLDEGVPFEVLVTDILGPVEIEIGRRWSDGDLTVADEHASTAAAESLVAMLVGTLGPAGGPAVVVACPENDSHSLPGRVVAATLAVRGFRALFLGGSLPAEDLGEYLEQQQPMALALSVSMGSALFRATQSIAVAHTQRIPVIIGGQAIGPDAHRTRALGADAFARTAADAGELLDRWIVLPPDELAPDARIHPECQVLERVGPQLVATALEDLAATNGQTSRWAEELARVLQVVQGALVLDDPEILVAHVAALRSSDRARGFEPALIDRSLSGLAAAMTDHLAAARVLLLGVAA